MSVIALQKHNDIQNTLEHSQNKHDLLYINDNAMLSIFNVVLFVYYSSVLYC